MISLRSLTDHTIRSYSTYIKVYLGYLDSVLHKSSEDVSWDELRDFISWLQTQQGLSDRTINHCISQLRFFSIYVLHRPWDAMQLPMCRFDSFLPYIPSEEEIWTFISSISDLKFKAIIALTYSSGLSKSLLTSCEMAAINDFHIRQMWDYSYDDYDSSGQFQSDFQRRASHAILNCKTGKLGRNLSICEDCSHTQIHNNFCRNRNCPNCQAVKKEVWVDKRSSEVIDTPYFHVVFMLPHELNALLYCNQKLLYSLFHKCCARTLLELSAGKKFQKRPGIIQVLHTWNQELLYHVHMHCIISGGSLTPAGQIRKSKSHFLSRFFVLRDKFKGKFFFYLEQLYRNGQLCFSSSCGKLRNTYS